MDLRCATSAATDVYLLFILGNAHISLFFVLSTLRNCLPQEVSSLNGTQSRRLISQTTFVSSVPLTEKAKTHVTLNGASKVLAKIRNG